MFNLPIPPALRGFIKDPQSLLALIGGGIALVAAIVTAGVLGSGAGSSAGDAGKPAEGQSTVVVKKADGQVPAQGNCQLKGISPEEVVRRTNDRGVFHWKFEPGEYTVSASCLVPSPATSSTETLKGETTFTVEDSPVTVTITVK
ncbi:hypothetical protein CPHO_00720 [Corynebacterium phocae]|uniref:Uncharacterized protein n=1 Tax=Corynebacterium phocae TaxID=161895 RepID=A0A1L7D156_9CORY|nr:hypothetical protein [Corynebacterium phocae]APT91691.1 hypothetical protein CPHO_00720 [Corynebacterium phocae]KAA8728600.1 hypothetical protein F4V58_00270 [Corynebacterium phocae]